MDERTKMEAALKGLIVIKNALLARMTMDAVGRVATQTDIRNMEENTNKFVHGAYMRRKNDDEKLY